MPEQCFLFSPRPAVGVLTLFLFPHGPAAEDRTHGGGIYIKERNRERDGVIYSARYTIFGTKKVRRTDSCLLTPPGVSIEDLDPFSQEQCKLVRELVDMTSLYRYNIEIFRQGWDCPILLVELGFTLPVDMFRFLHLMNRARYVNMQKAGFGRKVLLYMIFYPIDVSDCNTQEEISKYVEELKRKLEAYEE